jgi:hypothetical protein
MMFGYVNGSARKAVSAQREAIEALGINKIWQDNRGNTEEWNHLTGLETGIGRGGPHQIVVAEFHLLSTTRDGLLARLKTIFDRGSHVLEALTNRSTENNDEFAQMLLEATDYYRGGMSKAERRKIAKMGAEASPVTKPKDGRMPATEAIKWLYDVSLTIQVALARINQDERYRTKWTQSYVYQQHHKGKIRLPQRVAGPKLKRT